MITVREYSGDHLQIWDKFVRESNDGTLFHTQEFLNYHPVGRFSTRSLEIYDGDSLVGVLPLAVSSDGKAAVSPYGGSFGGLVEKVGTKFIDNRTMWEALMLYLSQTYHTVRISPTPAFYSKVPCSYTDFNMWMMGFEISLMEVGSIIDLGRLHEMADLMDLYNGRTRTAIRKAKRQGVVTMMNSDALITFYDLLKESKATHDAEPTHTIEEMGYLRGTVPGVVKLDMAYLGDEPVAAALYFVCNPRVMLLFYQCTKLQYRGSCAGDLLLHQGIEGARKNGFRYLDLGTTTMPDGSYNPGLFMFKEGFGAVGHMRVTYEWKRKEEGNVGG